MQDTNIIFPPSPQLNSDIIRLIAAHLTKKDLAYCCQVSRTWRDYWAEALWSYFELIPKNTLSPEVLSRVGKFIQNVKVGPLYEDDVDKYALMSQRHVDILRNCVNVRYLEVGHCNVDEKHMRRLLASGPKIPINNTDGKNIQSTEPFSARLLRKGPKLGLFSNHLATLKIFIGGVSCEYIMHCLGVAGRTGLLQNLKSVYLSGPYHHTVNRKLPPPLRLSLLLLFIRSIPRMNALHVGDGNIYDDFCPDPVIDILFPPPKSKSPLRPAAMEPSVKKDEDMNAFASRHHYNILENLTICEFDSPSAMAKLLRRLPKLGYLTVNFIDEMDYLMAVRCFRQGNLKLTVKNRITQNITESDWIKFFDDDGYAELDVHMIPFTSQSYKLIKPKKPVGKVDAEVHGLSLSFGYSRLPGFTDNIANIIARSSLMAYQLTGITLFQTTNLSYHGVKAILYNCPNLKTLSLENPMVSYELFNDPTPWPCSKSLVHLTLFNLEFGSNGSQYLSNARNHFHRLNNLQHLSLGGRLVTADLLLDDSDMGRGERLYTPAGAKDLMVWPNMSYFSLSAPNRYVTLKEFKVFLTMFPLETWIELWAWVEVEAENWIMKNRPDLEYILHSCDYYG
ncbi:hypothetical protein FBU30_007098 [Linnemannia zychae]|nr:hypothetical protein FBU30_007098 [Linnemannia zychae]